MRFGRDVPAVIIGAIALALALLAGYAAQLFAAQTRSVETAAFAQLRAIVDFNLRGAEDRALARAEMIAAMPSVQAAFAARDRERLLAELLPLYRIQADKYGVSQAQFHLPPATSFLRLDDPPTHGDDLSPFRPIIVAVNTERAAHRGLSVGRSGPAIFGVVPVSAADGTHLGSFEVGMDFGPLLDRLKAGFGIESTLFLDAQLLRSVATGLPGEQLDEHRRIGNYLRLHSTHWQRMQPLVGSIDLGRLNGSDHAYVRESDGEPYAVALHALRRPDGTAIGVIVAARDLGSTHGAAAHTAMALATAALSALVLLAAVVVVTIRGLLLRPLARVAAELDAIAAGAPPEPESEAPACREIAELSERVARLRERSPPTEAP